MTLQPPGVPPGDPGSSRSRGSADGEARILNVLTHEGGSADRAQLYRWSGLRATDFTSSLENLIQSGAVEERGGRIVLRGA